LYTREEIRTFDHDFGSFADGVVIPHGIYDMRHNTGHISIGTSRDTSEFACDSIRIWWHREGMQRYPGAEKLLILCDGGGSNSSRHYLFKEDLVRLADELGIRIRVTHYPPYTSKYNPIEHRLFPHVTSACEGVVFTSVGVVKELMEKTATRTGLRVTVDIIDKVYQTGRRVSENFKNNMRISFDDYLPRWNYETVPANPALCAG